MSIEIKNVSKSFGTVPILRNVSLSIGSGELVGLLGPSGSGKTTLLRVIAGMEVADTGSGPVLFDGQDISAHGISERRIGFVFQHYALFRTMTVFENIAFGLRARPWRSRPSERQIRAKVDELMDLIQLQGFTSRYPSQLSGGQRQRVALARALAVEPRVLLLDEPFGALDAKVRRELRRWLRRLHETIHVTTIFVTHDQEEALELSDRVAVMRKGQIEQFASPQDVYDNPTSLFVYQFLGHYNEFAGLRGGSSRAGLARDGLALVRPHEVAVARDDPQGQGIAARIRHIGVAGPTVRIELERLDDNGPIDAELPAETCKALQLRVGDSVYVTARRAQTFEDYAI